MLEFETARYGLYRNWARAVTQQPGETRGRSGLWQELDPNRKKATNWRFAEVMHIPDVACDRCQILIPVGTINCVQCGQLMERMPDIKKIARVVRLQEMANSLGVPLSMDQVETQILTQRKDARGDRSARGGLGIMKDIAKKAVLRNKEYNTLYERLINDPFYAYTAARGDLTPSALEFIEKVARCIIPNFVRTKEMIQGSVAVPKYHARLTLVPPTEDVQEVDPKDVYVVHGGRFLEPEQFAALYGSLDKSNRYSVMGWTRDFSSVGDPEMVLVELLCFVEEEIPNIEIPGRATPLPAVVGVARKPILQLRETGGQWQDRQWSQSYWGSWGQSWDSWWSDDQRPWKSSRNWDWRCERSFQQSTGHRCASRERRSVEAEALSCRSFKLECLCAAI